MRNRHTHLLDKTATKHPIKQLTSATKNTMVKHRQNQIPPLDMILNYSIPTYLPPPQVKVSH
jgi:hypothetical protein